MRRQFLLLLAILFLAKAEAAVACSYAPGYEPPSDEELFAKASSVFVGHVFRVEKAGVVSQPELLAFPPWWKKVESLPPKAAVERMPPIPAIEATFRLVEVFKGEPPSDGKIRAPIYMPVMRRHLWSVLMLVLVGIDAAIGSSCPPDDGWSLASMERRYAEASTVFIGHLVRVEEAGVLNAGELLSSRPAVEGTFHVVEVLKGHPPADGKTRAPAPAACVGPLLLVGFDHVVFLNESNLIRSWGEAILLYSHPGHLGDGGSKRLLEKLRELSKKEPK